MANQKGIPKQAQKQAFVEAMSRSFGNISASCRTVGISRKTAYDWAKEDPVFKEAMNSDDYREAYMDAIEGKLAKLGLTEENPTILIFLAKTIAKKRGYVESIESKHSGIPAGIVINVTSQENAEKLAQFINTPAKN